MDPEEARFIARLNDRDEEAFDELISRYDKLLRMIAIKFLLRRMSPGRADVEAEEIIQDAYCDIYERGLREIDSVLKAYLIGIVRHKALDRVRDPVTFEYFEHISIDSFGLIILDQNPDPEAQLLGRERRDILTAAVSKLPPLDQQILNLWLRDLSYEEIANSLEITTSSVKARLFRSREALKRVIPTRREK